MKKLVPVAMSLALLAAGGSVFAQASSSGDDSGNRPVAKASMDHVGLGKGGLFRSEELLSLLNVDQNTLREELKSGKSLVEIAADKGVSETQLIELLVNAETERIDAAVKEGKLSQAKAEKIKSSLEERIKDLIEHKGAFRAPHGPGGKLEEAASILGIDPEQLFSELKSGKTIAQIAQEKGISREQLINALLEKEKERISKWVDQTWKEKPDDNGQ